VGLQPTKVKQLYTREMMQKAIHESNHPIQFMSIVDTTSSVGGWV